MYARINLIKIKDDKKEQAMSMMTEEIIPSYEGTEGLLSMGAVMCDDTTGLNMSIWTDKDSSDATESNLQSNIEKQMNIIEKNYTFLATVGSTAPFIGLFGTVWGIMNSFQSIAISRNTSLAIVAPGIAEALFATALGLLAAIPAVVAYNKFSNDSKKYFQKLENFSKRFISII